MKINLGPFFAGIAIQFLFGIPISLIFLGKGYPLSHFVIDLLMGLLLGLLLGLERNRN